MERARGWRGAWAVGRAVDNEDEQARGRSPACGEPLMLLILDIRDLSADRRLACVLRRFEALGAGDALRVITDREPQRWRDALLADARWHAEWLPERQEPGIWVIRIKKRARTEHD